jgi:hypothetical protein
MPVLLAREVASVQDAHSSNLDHEHGRTQNVSWGEAKRKKYSCVSVRTGRGEYEQGERGTMRTGIVAPELDTVGLDLLVVVDGLDLVHRVNQVLFIVQHLLHGDVAV